MLFLLLLSLLTGVQLLLVFMLPLRLVLRVLRLQCGHLIAVLQCGRVRLLLRGERLALPAGALLRHAQSIHNGMKSRGDFKVKT